jgi:adenosine deaminase
MDLRALPKVELHLHVDTSLSFVGASELDPSVTQAIYDRDFKGPLECRDLADFLSHVPPILNLLQTERGLQVMIEDMFRQMAADGMVYAELRFAPLQHLRGGLTPRDVVRIVEAATQWAVKDSGIESRLILCSLRHYSAEQSMETVQLVNEFRGSFVVGFDLAGDEAGHPLATHLEAFRYAEAHGLPITSHAGEACGAESVWETLEAIHPPRIGHGVRAIEDPALIQRLKQDHIHLEMCPTCNVQLNVFPSYAAHPIDRLYREGLSLGISTDNRTLTPITMTGEYERLATTFGWGKVEFMQCALNALEAAFVEEPVKERLRREIVARYAA